MVAPGGSGSKLTGEFTCNEGENTLAEQCKRDAVQRVTSSQAFRQAPKLREFLTYVCEEALRVPPGQPRERDIGQIVYGRSADYSPVDDNIVRVEARVLRKRLTEYYASEGKDDAIVITIPKGGYLPAFERVVVPEPTIEPEQATPPAAQPATPVEPRRYRVHVVAALGLAVLAFAAGWLIRPVASTPGGPGPEEMPVLLRPIFDSKQPAMLVLPDSVLALLQDLSSRTFTLGDYLAPGFPRPEQMGPPWDKMPSAVHSIATRRYLSFGDALIASRFVDIAARGHKKLEVRFARDLEIRDFRNNNAILVGTASANPWVDLFRDQLNFQFELSLDDLTRRRTLFRNLKPKAGEPAVFATGRYGDPTIDVYGSAALLPNLSREGSVLIVGGTEMYGVETAGMFLTDPARSFAAAKELGLGAGKQHFEIMLKSVRIGHSATNAEIVAHRVLD